MVVVMMFVLLVLFMFFVPMPVIVKIIIALHSPIGTD